MMWEGAVRGKGRIMQDIDIPDLDQELRIQRRQ